MIPSLQCDILVDHLLFAQHVLKICISSRMKSRLLYGRRIDDDSGVNPLAVVIIESTEPDRFTFDDLSGQFGPSGQRYIRGLAQKLSAKLPHISEARKMGL